MTAGRTCPLDYRYAPTDFRSAPCQRTEALYVVGGLYGNHQALDAVLALFGRETAAKHLIFNGDFNWFNIDPERFEKINESVLSFDAIRGNVETELAHFSPGSESAGCGCAYPEWVDDEVVTRSNTIMARLGRTALQFPELRRRLAMLPMYKRIDVGSTPVAVVHGDAESLAGWGFAPEHLRQQDYQLQASRWLDEASVRLFACTHTCSPVLLSLPNAKGEPCAIANNGAAGMPNFAGTGYGLLTRIALFPHEGKERLYGIRIGDVYVEALKIDYDNARWQSEFLSQWPPRSPAHVSYWDRIKYGPSYALSQAVNASSLVDGKGSAMPTAVWNSTVIAQASKDAVKIVEGNVYFPPATVDHAYLVPSETVTRCAWKGSASYFHVVVNGQTNRDAAWVYRHPLPAAGAIAGHIAFWRGIQVSE